MRRCAALWLAAALLPARSLAAQAPAEESTLARLLEDGFLVAADDNSFFGEVLHARVQECTVSVFKADGDETEEVRLDLHRIHDLSVAAITIGTAPNGSAAWVEASDESGEPLPPRATPPILRLLWTNAELTRAGGKPQDAAGAANVRYVIWGGAEETHSKAERLLAAFAEVEAGCG
jgi:hypothetical protein